MHGDFWALLTKNAVLLRRLREEVLKSRSEKPQYGKKCSNAADMDSCESREGAGRAAARLDATAPQWVAAAARRDATAPQWVAAAGRRGAATS